MGIFRKFKKNKVNKGKQLADYAMSLYLSKDFESLIDSLSKPMSLRVMVDFLLVCQGASATALSLILKNRMDEKGDIYESIIDKLAFYLENMDLHLRVNDIIVDENERDVFLRQGWAMTETTTIYTIFSVIGDHRIERYTKAIGEGLIEATQMSDGSRLTAGLMKETKRVVGMKMISLP
ncbi:hypothetical protein ACFL2E_12765 [Thermodesulfobacteriota bacterium]